MKPALTAGACAQLACLLEATARKPGNVHRFADFHDSTYLDFLLSARAVAPAFDAASMRGVGETVLEAVRATRRFVASNTNLGMILLFAPLARSFDQAPWRPALQTVLESLTVDDARSVYEAVRLANPGGLDSVPDQDVRDEPSVSLLQAMALAAERDDVARQYISGYADIFEEVVPRLDEAIALGWPLERAIIWSYLQRLANSPDTLIARKRGAAVAREASDRARFVLQSGWPTSGDSDHLLDGLDRWLRDDGHARNPGTTADLVAAGLFVALRDGTIEWPLMRFGMDPG